MKSRFTRQRLTCFPGMLVLALISLPFPAIGHGDSEAFSGDHHAHDKPGEQAPAPVPKPERSERDWPVVETTSTLIGSVVIEAREPEMQTAAFARVVPRRAAVKDINAYLAGQISDVHVRPGLRVEKGDLIASIYSPEFILTQKAYLALLGNEELKETLREEGRLPNYMRDARSNLRWWGMGEDDILALEARRDPVEQLNVRAGSAGVITEVFVEPGEVISPGDRAMENFVVTGAPIARMVLEGGGRRLEGLTFSDTLGNLGEGARVQVRLDGRDPLELPVTQAVRTVDAANRLGRFIVDLDEPLEVGRMVHVSLLTWGKEGAWLPREAIMGDGTGPVAFVEVGQGRYERRQLNILERMGEWALADAVAVGERVVTRGKTLLEGAYRLGDRAASGDHHHH